MCVVLHHRKSSNVCQAATQMNSLREGNDVAIWKVTSPQEVTGQDMNGVVSQNNTKYVYALNN